MAKVIELAANGSEASLKVEGLKGLGVEEVAQQTAAALALAAVNDENLEVNNNKEMFKTKLDIAVKGMSAKVKAGEEILAEDVAPANAALEAEGLAGFAIAKIEDIEALEASIETITAAKTAAEDKVVALENELTTATAEVERLGKMGGAKPTVASKPDGDTAHGGGEPVVISETDAELNAIIAKQNGE